ncbi:MAG: c-type cytochrome [Ignavibacteria bacterium]|nr:c-type cytochrome [Ignavibacteria bacterium]
MKKLFKVLMYSALGVITIVVIFFIYFNSTFPKSNKPAEIKIDATPERLARGEYLVNHVAICVDCHSARDYSKFSGPIIKGSEGKGGEVFNKENIGLPGSVFASNITPSGIGGWTDGELIRAITCGVNKKGEALFPLMPYMSYNGLTQEDLFSIVAYIRTLKPIENKVPGKSLDFPLNIIVKTIPLENFSMENQVNKSNSIEYGKYLVQAAACFDCHTPQDKGKPIAEKYFAGGMEFYLPGGTIRSANITPDVSSGIGTWTKEQFIQKFKSFDSDSAKNVSVGEKSFNTIMPWTTYAGMTKEDLGNMYDYLRTLKPVTNIVNKFSRKE